MTLKELYSVASDKPINVSVYNVPIGRYEGKDSLPNWCEDISIDEIDIKDGAFSVSIWRDEGSFIPYFEKMALHCAKNGAFADMKSCFEKWCELNHLESYEDEPDIFAMELFEAWRGEYITAPKFYKRLYVGIY